VASVTAGAPEAGVVKADVQITEGRLLALTLLGRLGVAPKAEVHAIALESGKLKADVQGSLAKLVSIEIKPELIGCPTATAVADLAARETRWAAGALSGAVSTHALGDIVDAGGSLLAKVVDEESARLRDRVQADVNCQPSSVSNDGSSATGSASGSGEIIPPVSLKLGL
jgi:hypothetical protein